MSDYQLTVELVEIEKEKLILEVSATGPFLSYVKSPVLSAIFATGDSTRRLPVLGCTYDKLDDGRFYIYCRYTYSLSHLFFENSNPKEIRIWFELKYGEEVFSHDAFVLGGEEKNKPKIKSTAKGKQKRSEQLPYRVEFSKDLKEVILKSDMEPYRMSGARKFLFGVQDFFFGLWSIIEFLIALALIPVYCIDAIFAMIGSTNRRQSIEEGGIIYFLKHIRWRMDNFTGRRIGVLGVKLLTMNISNWIGRHTAVKSDRIVFLSNRRDDLTGNFEFVYEKLKEIDDKIKYKFVLTSHETVNMTLSEFAKIGYYFGCSKVILVDDFLEILYMMPRRKNTKLIQLWHACGAFKTFGYTRMGKEGGQRQDSPNHRNYDLTTVSSKEICKYYAEGFGLSLQKVVATGIPRTDVFFDNEHKERVVSSFYEKYPHLKEKKIILFAPTFRGNGKNSGFYPVEQFNVNKLYETIGEDYAIIIKHHPFVKNRNKIKKEYNKYIIDMSANSELNDLLFVTDVLITDYSSVIFEAALLDIPMLFYVYDLNQYIATRGFYYEFETFVPGKIVKRFEDIAPAITSNELKQELIKPFKERFFDDLDGKSSERTAKLIYDCLKN